MDVSLRGESLFPTRPVPQRLKILQFVDSPPNSVSQQHEYAAGNQHSDTVAIARSLFGDSSRVSALSVPLKRATVVEKVAHGLHTFMVSWITLSDMCTALIQTQFTF